MRAKQHTIQESFKNLLAEKFPELKPIEKWKQTMWHHNGDLVVSLVPLSKKVKFCFFNTPHLELDKTQRWGTTTSSENLEIPEGSLVDWEQIETLIASILH
ncbi:DUF1801 domain-containing protein [Aggregatimonas sangjinii]|uniref:DUF1801 domain-containing protein n=1 Tax=Aggregatimonas sangjinii TaxID=2583587 RepID=A0A5B7SRU9_9FLAO|nr:DUF1801 domain-containing protein [Aggregatimonas sangjinii]QCX01336.1 DUF1801 domain-containing protein [Aggregatimonas sangjinii]